SSDTSDHERRTYRAIRLRRPPPRFAGRPPSAPPHPSREIRDAMPAVPVDARARASPCRHLCCLLRVPPPDGWESCSAVLWQFFRPAETIPARRPLLAVRPLRHNVVVPQQHAIEGARRSHKLVTALGENDAIDQRVDRGVFDSDQVSGTRLLGGLGSPVAALFVAGRQRLAPTAGDDVEVRCPQAVFVLSGIDSADTDADAEPLQRRFVKQHHALELFVVDEELDTELFVGGDIDQFAAAYLVSGLLQQCYGLPEISANRFRVSIFRIGVGRRKDFRRNLVPDGFENLALKALWQAGGGKLGAVEIAVDARVLPGEKLL